MPYSASRLKVYVTFNVSPDTTVLSPGDWKSASENSTPDVPEATVQRKAPATIPPAPVIAKLAGDAVFEMTDGSAVLAVPNVMALRVPE
jgi:hypothetical protein